VVLPSLSFIELRNPLGVSHPAGHTKLRLRQPLLVIGQDWCPLTLGALRGDEKEYLVQGVNGTFVPTKSTRRRWLVQYRARVPAWGRNNL